MGLWNDPSSLFLKKMLRLSPLMKKLALGLYKAVHDLKMACPADVTGAVLT